MPRRTVLALVVCSGVFGQFAGVTGRRFSNCALVWLTNFLIGQKESSVALHANPCRIASLAVWARCTIKRLALEVLRQLISEVTLQALIMGRSICKRPANLTVAH